MLNMTGLDYSASLEERECLLKDLSNKLPDYSVLVSTCDRVELYSGNGNVDKKIVSHLFSLCSGIMSPLLGEKAIQGQVKKAYQSALRSGKTGKTLNMLFQHAISCGKKVRKHTRISNGALGHGQLAFNLVKKQFLDLGAIKVIVLGVNNISCNFLSYLKTEGVRVCFVSNRSLAKAKDLADKFGFEALPYNNLENSLFDADVLLTCSSAPHFLVSRQHVSDNRNLLIIDLAVPRDVDPSVTELQNITLYNIEDIEQLHQRNLSRRNKEINKAEKIIDQEVIRFYERLSSKISFGNQQDNKNRQQKESACLKAGC